MDKKMPRFAKVQVWIAKVINNKLVPQIQKPLCINKNDVKVLEFLLSLYIDLPQRFM